ncbi:hypothetical protein [Arthrobacter sp. UYCu712]|uniref:hypothetical protein n=1 Tax=Arthrobacter sp. UYCu712 TaxID=3156340 RepID=UPI00339AEFEB
MDQNLNAHVKLDIASDVVRIDVRGSLTQASRPFLLQIIQRVRQMGISSHIRVDLGRAGFVESVALAGLRNDLNTIDGGAARPDVAGAVSAATGVSLDLNPDREDPAAVLRSIDISGDFTASLDSSGTRTLTGFTDDELLAASDSVFGRLDDPADMASSELLASYDEIGLEISRREVGREPEPA